MEMSNEFRQALENALRCKTAYQVSKETGVSITTIGEYLSGRRKTLTLDTASRIAPAIGVSLRQDKIKPK